MKIGLVKKLSFWYLLIALPSFLILNLVVSGIISANNEATIENDLLDYKTNCEIYITRAVLGENLPASQDSFQSISQNIADDLGAILGKDLAFYTPAGEIIYSGFQGSAANASTEDVSYAAQGKNAYTIVYGDRTYVYFSFPITMSGQTIGIMRLRSEYTSLYQNGNYILNMVTYGAACILFMAFLLFIISMAKVIGPIRKLRNSIVEMTRDPEHIEPIQVRRQDEIGELTQEYNDMALTIKDQLNTIRLEKENLKKTIEYRKDFYDNITHELKTPLTIILGYAEMMEQTHMEDPAFNEKGLHEIITETKRLRDMVGALLEVSRETGRLSAKFEDIDLCGLIQSLQSSMNIKAKRYGATIETKLPERAIIHGDPERLRQLFINLLDNAIKYGVAGESISVEVADMEDHVKIEVSNAFEGNVDLLELNKIFMPFYQSRKSGKKEDGSVGLGLAICKNIADAHGGSITALRQEHRLCFQVILPASAKGSEGTGQ